MSALNMFQNCKIEGTGIDPRGYHGQNAAEPRGSEKFVMSPSSVKAFAAQPHRWRQGYQPPQSRAQRWGDVLDCRWLTPGAFEKRFAVEPLTYSVTVMRCPSCGSETDSKSCRRCGVERVGVETCKPWRYGASIPDGWLADRLAEGKEPISNAEVVECDKAIATLLEPVGGDDTIQRWFDASDRQVLVRGEWHDEDTGLVIPVSCLLDFAPRKDTEFSDCLGDFKTTTSAHPGKFTRQAFQYGYHIQAAMDLDLYQAATGEPRSTWCFIIQESYEPWEVNRAMFGQEADMGQPGFVDLGRMAYRKALANYCKCLQSGRWPRYNDSEQTVQGWCVLRPTPWMEGEEMDLRFDADEMPEPEPGNDGEIIP